MADDTFLPPVRVSERAVCWRTPENIEAWRGSLVASAR
jgi:hypothetical protein